MSQGPHKPPAIDPADGSVLVPKYDPADFIVAPADAKGVSYRMTFRCPPNMEKSIDMILSSNRFPFTTRGDLLRWAVQEGVKHLEAMEGLTAVSKQVDIITGILNEEASHSEFLQIFTQLDEAIHKYMADQAPEQASRVIALTKHKFESMPDGYWRDRYLLELDKRFGHLLKNQTGGTLK